MIGEHQYCTFYVDRHFFGVDVRKVQEVVRFQRMTRVPLAPAEVRGLINLRGQIVTAIELRRRLDLDEPPAGQLPVNVVVQSNDGAVSLLVDDVGDVLQVMEKDFERLPETMTGASRDLIRGACQLPQGLLLILDIERTVNVLDGN